MEQPTNKETQDDKEPVINKSSDIKNQANVDEQICTGDVIFTLSGGITKDGGSVFASFSGVGDWLDKNKDNPKRMTHVTYAMLSGVQSLVSYVCNITETDADQVLAIVKRALDREAQNDNPKGQDNG